MSNQLEAAIIKRHDLILILDFGSQYTHIIARRIRELGVYCEVHACNVSADFIKSFQATGKLKGIILSGSPYSVYEEGSPHANPVVWDLGVPILGICYGAQEIALQFGGAVEAGAKREYGHAKLNIVKTESGASALFHALPDEIDVWMSHGDKVTALPEGFVDIGVTSNSEHAAFYSAERNIYAIQFHAEVFHTPLGKDIFNNFVDTICGCKKDWSMGSFLEESIEAIRAQVGPNGIVIGAVSGGVDSTVAAVLMNRALGDRFHAYFIDNGVLRLNEQEEVKKRLIEKEGINLTVVDASDLFLSKLEGVTDPEKKRKIIGNTFIEVFQEEALKLEAKTGHIEFLLQGTLYPDVIESVSFKGPSATIKTHHNVGGLLENMRLKLVEPLRELFKDEVRQLGRVLGIGEESIMRHPFPGPGLAIRVLGAITREQLDILKQADAIYLEEIKKAGIYNEIAQAFAVILPVRTVGVMGDARTYAQVIALRAVQSTDFMTADWYPMPYDLLKRISSRIINEVKGVNRVVYDVSSKPPSTIEWE